MSQTFLSTFCSSPTRPVIKAVTEQEVVNHFTTYIENSCIDSVTVVKYSMPKDFYGRISYNAFWSIITSFLKNNMKFTIINPNYFSIGMLFDYDYNSMPFQLFYRVTQKQASHHGEYFMQDYNCTDDSKIDFVVFRIYKA